MEYKFVELKKKLMSGGKILPSPRMARMGRWAATSLNWQVVPALTDECVACASLRDDVYMDVRDVVSLSGNQSAAAKTVWSVCVCSCGSKLRSPFWIDVGPRL